MSSPGSPGPRSLGPRVEVRAAALVVINPAGNRSRTVLDPLPFLIGRSIENQLVLRDNRASRSHARIVVENGEYLVEDLNSRHGVFVNGSKISRQALRNSDRIDFGIQDSYSLIFTLEGDEINRILEQISAPAAAGAGNLGKLRALVEVARALQSSLSTQDVLAAVVDAALAVTGSERGFLLLRNGAELDVSVSRDRRGRPLPIEDLRVPMSLINRALKTRRELLSMSFDPLGEQGPRADHSVANLELRSVVCVPLVRVRAGSSQETMMLSSLNDTVGLLYMDSRLGAADLSSGNRELLQTLALEASTVLENARLLEEERSKQRMEEELNIAREIQKGLLPNDLPSTGWFRAEGSSIPSHQVGGDYFDVRQVNAGRWAVVVADVSGKGVSSALLASFLQGAFLMASQDSGQLELVMSAINRFLNERTKGEKYATLFYCTVDSDGLLRWANAGHCQPYLLKRDGKVRTLRTTGMPIGLLEQATHEVDQTQLDPGDKIVAYSDGLSEAENTEGETFDKRLLAIVRSHAGSGCRELHRALVSAVEAFSEGTVVGDDITAVVLEYLPE